MKMPNSEVRVFYESEGRQQEKKTTTVYIKARTGLIRPQRQGVEGLAKITRKLLGAKSYKELEKWGGIATGYANALYDIDLISRSELADIIEVIDRAGWKVTERIEAARHPFWSRIKRRMVSV